MKTTFYFLLGFIILSLFTSSLAQENEKHGKNRERVGELILRLGMRAFLQGIGLDPVPQTVKTPWANPFFFWHQEDFDAEAAGRKYIKL